MSDDLTVQAAPRISLAKFQQVLTQYKSPAVFFANSLYTYCIRYGIDPAVALAFFVHESSCGTQGICAEFHTRNWGNVRQPYRAALAIGHTDHPFAIYGSWANGLIDWCERIIHRYIGRGLTTVHAITPVYAPSADHNKPAQYADAVCAMVARWQQEDHHS